MHARIKRRPAPNIWPGFVDAISTLLIIILFLLMVFTLAQHFLSEMLTGRNEALNRLTKQVAELSELLLLEQKTSSDLRNEIATLTANLKNSVSQRDALKVQLDLAHNDRDQLKQALAVSEAKERLTSSELVEAFKTIEADQKKITLQIGELELLRRDIATLRELRARLEKDISSKAEAARKNEKALLTLRDKTKELELKLKTEAERTSLAQKKIAETQLLLSRMSSNKDQLEKDLTEEKKLSEKERTRVEALNAQILALRMQLARISAALEAYEEKSKRQKVQILSLGKRLNAALAAKVEELAKYRSEFFGKLSEILGSRSDIQIVGDRFVFQSEVLFDSGSDKIKPLGREQVIRLGKTLSSIASRIPGSIDWVLRVDGHTDKRPIKSREFPSNWELSTARAISVVKLLIGNGLPPERLVAAGFGEFHPIEDALTNRALQRNRRIEFKLTNR